MPFRTQINRDSFARETLTRSTVKRIYGANYHPSCKFCGQTARFVYFVESDGGRDSQIPGEFCSVGCMRAYHG